MYKTKIDLSEKTRRNVIVILNERLSDAIDLQSQVKQAHWNVKGPHFIALHELFDKISDAMLEQIDEIAERITSLGGTPKGRWRWPRGAASSRIIR
jgi:starvation-inducible DNA-binding protein